MSYEFSGSIKLRLLESVSSKILARKCSTLTFCKKYLCNTI